jgi:hypothetical protein
VQGRSRRNHVGRRFGRHDHDHDHHHDRGHDRCSGGVRTPRWSPRCRWGYGTDHDHHDHDDHDDDHDHDAADGALSVRYRHRGGRQPAPRNGAP